ncbi:hypothetical protein [Streptomyces mirabilis]|uniref:hypothetical protein n=1 Tax=Streptomyces mirabilis TaxID=68239 RepID=UPI0036472EEF
MLLERREGIVLDSWATYWLGKFTETIDDCDDPAERARFTGWVETLVRAAHGHAASATSPPRGSRPARRLHSARSVTPYPPHGPRPGTTRKPPRTVWSIRSRV